MKIFRRAAPMLGLLGVALLALPLAAAPRSIRDCEKIQGADAYNQCLASFGPVAHMHGMKSAPGGDEGGGDEGGGGEGGDSAAAPPPSRHSYHHGHGRQHIIIEVGSGAPHVHRHWHWHHHRHH
jgi:hypothetical protein